MTLAAVLVTVSEQASAQALTNHQQSVVANLQNSSNTIKSQIQLGMVSAQGLANYANAAKIVDPEVYKASTITETQRSAYNTTLSTFKETSFYNAQQFFTDQANASKVQLQGAISELAAAAVDLQKTITVNQVVGGITDSPTAQAAQAVIANTGIGSQVTLQQAQSYNTSLASVSDYASKTGAFFAAANNQTITSTVDLTAQNYNKSLYTASAAYTYTNDNLTVSFDSQYSAGFGGFLQNSKVTAQQFFDQPQLYSNQ